MNDEVLQAYAPELSELAHTMHRMNEMNGITTVMVFEALTDALHKSYVAWDIYAPFVIRETLFRAYAARLNWTRPRRVRSWFNRRVSGVVGGDGLARDECVV